MKRLLLALLLIPQLAIADREFYSAYSLAPNATAQGDLYIANNGYIRSTGTAARFIGNDSTNRTMLIAADTNGAAAANLVLLTDATQGGGAELASGVASSAGVTINAKGASGTVVLKTANATKFTINAAGEFIGAGTASLGWVPVDGADNTACTSICTAPAVFGFNLAGGATAPVLVSATDATADICFCAGAS